MIVACALSRPPEPCGGAKEMQAVDFVRNARFSFELYSSLRAHLTQTMIHPVTRTKALAKVQSRLRLAICSEHLTIFANVSCYY